MTDQDAVYYQHHKDDPDEWGDAEQDDAPVGNLVTVVSIRLSADQERVLRARAEAHGQPLSRYIREAALGLPGTEHVLFSQGLATDWLQRTSTAFDYPGFTLVSDPDGLDIEPMPVNLSAYAARTA